MTTATDLPYTVETTTGAYVPRNGRREPERAGRVISQHATEDKAIAAAQHHRRTSPLGSPVAVYGPAGWIAGGF